MKNPNGFGSVYKLSGSRRRPWRAIKTVAWSAAGKQTRRIVGDYPTRAEALAALAACTPDMLSRPSRVLFSEVCSAYLKTKETTISRNSYITEQSMLRHLSSLYTMPIADIRASHLQAAIDTAAVSPGTKRFLVSLLGRIYKYALKMDLVVKSYAGLIDAGKFAPSVARSIFTEDEIARLWSNLTMPAVPQTLILIYTGMRVGELLRLSAAAWRKDGSYFIGGIKTSAGKDRYIPVCSRILPIVADLLKRQDRLYIGSYDTFRHSYLAMLAVLGMKHTVHDCRHTFISRLGTAGVPLPVISRIVGHAGTAITDRVYTHKDIAELLRAVDIVR